MTSYYDLPKVGVNEFSRPDFVAWFQGELKRINNLNQQEYALAVQKSDFDYAQTMKAFGQLLTLGTEIYGDKSAVVKYLKAHKPRLRVGVSAPPNFTRRARSIWSKYEAWFEDEQRREYARDYRRRRAEMNALLQELGYEPGEHYARSRAISFARQVINPAQPDVRMLPAGESESVS